MTRPGRPACTDHLDLWAATEQAVEQTASATGTNRLEQLAHAALDVCRTCPVLDWCRTQRHTGYTGVAGGRVLRNGWPAGHYGVPREDRVRELHAARRAHPGASIAELARHLGISRAYAQDLHIRPGGNR